MAAANQIDIMCGMMKIAGHAFCLGLERRWNLPATAVVPLMKGSGVRQNPISRDQGIIAYRYPLGELFDMYVAHKATQRHDKLYVLLGMISDDISKSGYCQTTIFHGNSSSNGLSTSYWARQFTWKDVRVKR